MGRHSSPEQGHFYRSIIAWALPWLMIAAAVIVAVYIAVDAVGKDDENLVPVARSTPSEQETVAEESESPPEETPEPEETKKDPRPKRTPEPKEDDTELITAGVTVQVLNATGASDADDRMANRLSALGYDVISIEGSSAQYPETTVFWSFPGAREAAERLANRFDWLAKEKPSNLSSTVDIHVVVGSDEA